MRIVTLEEHVTFPELTARIPPEALASQGIDHSPLMNRIAPQLADIGGERLRSMDESGITLQVLSVVGAGAQLLVPAEGVPFAKDYNDTLAEKIAGWPDRFAAFAHLPMTAPEAAAEELERTVQTYQFKGALINGLTQGQFLDHPRFAPILEKARQLDVPIYLHPGLPPKAVAEAYYGGLPKQAGMVLSVSGWGWHSETAIHILRLIVSGTLDRYPGLKLIIGHMGEMMPMMMARCDDKFKVGQTGANQRTVTRTLREQVYITTSGIFTAAPFIAAMDTFGLDNILFSVDYPFSSNTEGRNFLDGLALPADQLARIAYRNADKLLKLS